MKALNKKLINTIFLSIVSFIYFIFAINYSLMWFTSMGSESLSVIEILIVSLISLFPYLIILFLGIYKKSKSDKINYKVSYFIITFTFIYYIYLFNTIPSNLINNY